MKRRRRDIAARWMYRRGWTQGRLEGSVRHRLHDLLRDRRPWYDWGHPLMTILGRYDTGTWGVPRVRDLYYLHDSIGPIVTTTTDWRQVRGPHQAEWKVLDCQDDGFTYTIRWVDSNHPVYGIDRREVRLLLRWLLWDKLVVAEWFGVRRWAYYRGLHRAVEAKVPFTCQAVPPRDSGGYSHWHCDRPRRHDGEHRYRNYTWPPEGGRVRYAGDDSAVAS